MKKKIIFGSLAALLSISAVSGTLFTNSSSFTPVLAEEEPEPAELPAGIHRLTVLNVQDYIGLDVIEEFKEYLVEIYGESASDVEVIYECTDTPETMFNEVKLTPGRYDLICPSDYMIQKLISNDMITKLDFDLIPNYMDYASKYIKEEKLDPIEAKDPHGNIQRVGDFAVGYMWGTLGIVFDPIYMGRDFDKTVSDMKSWDVLWNADYHGIGTIKDSVRDTYAVGLLHAYDQDYTEGDVSGEGFNTLMNKHIDGTYDDDTYYEKFSNLFNRCDNTAIDKVRTSLNSLLGNVFGLEVDQGKQDIVLGKIGINFAWSGDAVYSLDLAEEAGNPKELYYSIPETGSNAWFDAWVMPKYEQRDECRVQLAHDFLNFMSDPEIAAENMDETGYTPFIGGDAILNQARDWYDARTDLIYYFDEEEEDEDLAYKSLFYFDPEDIEFSEPIEVWYDDCHFEGDPEFERYNDTDLYYYPNEIDEETVITFDDLIPLEEKYNERLLIDEELEEVDLSYMFEGTLEEESNAIFYSDCYLPFEGNECVGRQFFTQYPDLETLTRCAVMRDFGPQNDAVMAMWESFRSTSLPLWAIILFVVEIGIVLGGVGFSISYKMSRKSFRKKRKKEAQEK